MTKTNTKKKTMTMTKTNTFRKHLQRAILETCDLWDIWSEWWGDMTWPTKRQWKRQIQRKRQWQRQIHLENTFTSDPRDLWHLRHLIGVMRRHDLTNKKTMTKTNKKTKTMTKTDTFREHLQRATPETCNLWDFWSVWWGEMTWPKQRQWQRQIQRQRQWQRHIHLENTFMEWS